MLPDVPWLLSNPLVDKVDSITLALLKPTQVWKHFTGELICAGKKGSGLCLEGLYPLLERGLRRGVGVRDVLQAYCTRGEAPQLFPSNDLLLSHYYG